MRLLETIRIKDAKVFNLHYHQKRLDDSRSLLGYSIPLILTLYPPQQGEYRCRVIYEEHIEKIEYLPYQRKEINSFKIIHADIEYPLKYEDRREINHLFDQRGEADEIIIIKNGLVTDTSIANLAFFDKGQWITPAQPLLNGTTRQRLLDENKIICADIPYEHISSFSKIAVMNAMTDFQIIENAIIL